MLFDPDQNQPIPAREGERYCTINKTDRSIRVNGTPVYSKELATFVSQRQGRQLVWRKELTLD